MYTNLNMSIDGDQKIELRERIKSLVVKQGSGKKGNEFIEALGNQT
jgi:hypothetical protein